MDVRQIIIITLSMSLVFADTSYRILALLPYGSKSHKNVFMPLIEGLAAKGHHVTIVSSYDPLRKIPNVTDITLSENRELMEGQQKDIFNVLVSGSVIQGFQSMIPTLTSACDNFLKHPFTKELIKGGKQYDLAIVCAFINECAFPVGSIAAKNMMALSPAGMVLPSLSIAPSPPSFVNSPLTGFPTKMNFFQRLQNTLITSMAPLIFEFGYSRIQTLIEAHAPEAPSLWEAIDQVTFVFHNSDPVIDAPKPGAPNLVAVGAMHCKDAKSLPKDLEDFIQSSGDNGFIYFSLGSVAPSKYLPAEKKRAFMDALSRLKSKVIWKFEEDLPNTPANVKTVKWAPQQDILGHPKIRAFMTHGGLLSLQETVYHGVPVVAIPLFGDQPGNAARVQELGIGEKLDYVNLTSDNIYNTLNQVLNDQSYAVNMKKYSAILKDQPEKPLDRAMFWVEYVIRHDGAHHFRSAAKDLNFFQYFLLDVIAFVLGVAATVIFLMVYLVKKLLKKHVTKPKKQ